MTDWDFVPKDFHVIVIWSVNGSTLTRPFFVLNIKYIFMIFYKICYAKIENFQKHLQSIKKAGKSNLLYVILLTKGEC